MVKICLTPVPAAELKTTVNHSKQTKININLLIYYLMLLQGLSIRLDEIHSRNIKGHSICRETNDFLWSWHIAFLVHNCRFNLCVRDWTNLSLFWMFSPLTAVTLQRHSGAGKNGSRSSEVLGTYTLNPISSKRLRVPKKYQ